jgi:hypothetical protein
VKSTSSSTTKPSNVLPTAAVGQADFGDDPPIAMQGDRPDGDDLVEGQLGGEGL